MLKFCSAVLFSDALAGNIFFAWNISCYSKMQTQPDSTFASGCLLKWLSAHRNADQPKLE